MPVDRLGAHWRRHGLPATWSTGDDYTDGGTGTVIFDAPGADILGGAVQTTEYQVLYRASEFVGLTRDHTLTIADVCYAVRDVMPVDDGQLMRATLAKEGS